MIRDLIERELVIPLIIVALLAAMLGYFVTGRVAPTPHPTSVRVSVVGLPQSEVPTPSPTASAAPTTDTGGSSGGGGGGGPSCPAGCQCSGQPGGIVVICRP